VKDLFVLLYKIWKLLASVQYQSKAFVLLIMMFASMFLEMLSIGMVIPAITLLAGGDREESIFMRLVPSNLLALPQEKIITYGMLGLGFLFLIKTFFSAALFWWQTKFAFNLQARISEKLFYVYLKQPYTFHLQRNSAKLLSTLVTEVSLFTFQGVLSGLILILESLVIIGVGALLLKVELKGTIVAVSLVMIAAWVFHVLTKEKISLWGRMRQEHEGHRILNIQQGLAGVKEIKLGGKESKFLDRYQVHNIASARIGYLNHAMQQMPKQWLELLAIFILVGLVITMLYQGKSLDVIFAILGVFAIAAFRLLPSISRILVSLQSLRFGLPIVDVLYREINLPLQEDLLLGSLPKLQNNIEVKGVTFFYPETSSPAINDVTLRVGKGQMVGIVGQSGSGKSTLIDVILGLLIPANGQILCDGIDIAKNLKEWQAQIGYVPQSIYLTDDSIRSNIAFGLGGGEIDDQKIRAAITAAQLNDFINALPDGLNTIVGERGVRISGGQRQRIGIARALYYNPEILVLDEATSSLDAAMAQEVMNAVEEMRGERTILIVAHQIATIENCDQIYLFESGVLADSGRFEELYRPGSDGAPVRVIR